MQPVAGSARVAWPGPARHASRLAAREDNHAPMIRALSTEGLSDGACLASGGGGRATGAERGRLQAPATGLLAPSQCERACEGIKVIATRGQALNGDKDMCHRTLCRHAAYLSDSGGKRIIGETVYSLIGLT